MFRVLGRNDEQTTCDKCGKTNLKFTVVMESETTGVIRYGRDCAAVALGRSKKDKDLVARDATAIQFVHNMRANGRTLAEQSTRLWDRFGYANEIKDGKLIFQGATCLVAM